MENEKFFIMMQELEDTITCQVCFYRIEKPKMPSCLHSFCLVCITDMPLLENRLLHCPICREVTLVPRMDPKMLLTTFLVNQLSDIVVKHENLINRKEKIPVDINKSFEDIHGCKTEQETLLNVLETETQSLCNSSRSEPLRPPMWKHSSSSMAQEKTMGEEETTKRTRFYVQVEKSSSCQNDEHILMVKEMREEYIERENIQLKLWKFCNNNNKITPCCAWADKVDGTMVHISDRVINFNTDTLSDGGWLLSCQANCSGSFRVIIKVNGKQVKTIELVVEACK